MWMTNHQAGLTTRKERLGAAKIVLMLEDLPWHINCCWKFWLKFISERLRPDSSDRDQAGEAESAQDASDSTTYQSFISGFKWLKDKKYLFSIHLTGKPLR